MAEGRPITDLDFVEAADSVSPGSASFRADHAEASHPFFAPGRLLDSKILQLIGYSTRGTDGSILRHLPAVHPQFPFLFCQSAGGVVGFGVPDAEASRPAYQHYLPVVEEYSLYKDYTIPVTFAQRPYPVLSDLDIVPDQGVWFDENDEERVYLFASEWDRFLELEETYDPGIIMATQGQLTFRTASGEAPDGAAFAGTPRIPFPLTMLTGVWYAVPYHYVTSDRSFLKRFVHRVNQSVTFMQEYTFEPGELMYLGYDVLRRYFQPFPEVIEGGAGWTRFCDIRLRWSVARRKADDPPELPNRNWIPAGHNVYAWFGPNFSIRRRGYHYVSSFSPRDRDDPAYHCPVYESFPADLLFTDPDVAQPSPE